MLFRSRYNSDLADILGNLVNRTISMSNKYFDGVVKSTGVTEEVDADLKAIVTSARDKVDVYKRQEYIWNRMFPFNEHRRKTGIFQ